LIRMSPPSIVLWIPQLKWQLSAVFTKFQKATISFVMSLCPSVRPSVRPPVHLDSSESWYSRTFLKSVEKTQVPLKFDKNKAQFTWRPM
jgi:hypothetical protein